MANCPGLRRAASLWFVVSGLSLAAAHVGHARPDVPILSIGSPLPSIEGETISGKRLRLPDAAAGRYGLLVFTFSRKAGEAAATCAQAFTKLELPQADASSYAVMVLEGVPRIFRGTAVAGIRKGMPSSLHDTTIKLFSDEKLWMARLEVRSRDDPHLLVFDRKATVRWRYAGVCDERGTGLLAEQMRLLAAGDGLP